MSILEEMGEIEKLTKLSEEEKKKIEEDEEKFKYIG